VPFDPDAGVSPCVAGLSFSVVIRSGNGNGTRTGKGTNRE
jgi:hypothetical protein